MIKDNVKEYLKLKGYEIRVEGNKIVVFQPVNGVMIPYSTYICTSSGIVEYLDNHYEKICDLGTLEDNLLGVCCIVNSSRNDYRIKMSEDLRKISKSTSNSETINIFLKYLDKEYISKTYNTDINNFKQDSFNMTYDEGWYSLKLSKGENFITLNVNQNKNNIDRYALLYMLLKKRFDEEIVPIFGNDELSDELELKLYSVFSDRRSCNVDKITKEKVL